MKKLRQNLLIAAVSLLAACANPPAQAPGPTVPNEGAPPPVPDAPPPSPPATPSASTPAVPATPAQQQQAAKLASGAVELLQVGNEDQAKVEIQRALGLDASNKLALNLLRQITADPAGVLGRESYAYKVQPGETLSKIAGRVLGDIYSFYILARYNDIKVPRLVVGGQTIRLPGKPPAQPDPRPPASSVAEKPPANPLPPAPTPPPTAGELALRNGEAEEKRGNLEAALAQYERARALSQAGADEKSQKLRDILVARYSLAARKAYARQDLGGAISGWNKVLELDKDNDTAKVERQKALNLKKKLEEVSAASKPKG